MIILSLSFAAALAPPPPTGVSVVDGSGCYTSVVSWVAPQSKCNVAIGNYSVRYRLRNSTSGGYTTVFTDGTSVTLEGITANVEYNVSVAALSSQMSEYTETFQFELQGDLRNYVE